jgi:hypothetical protein
MVLPGLYRHYKGALYRVICLARHTESTKEYVIYKKHCEFQLLPWEDFDHRHWCRPVKMFKETVTHNGQRMPRFARLSDKDIKQLGLGRTILDDIEPVIL